MRAVKVAEPTHNSVVFRRQLHPDNFWLVEEIAPLGLRSADGSRPEIVLLMRAQPSETIPTLLISIITVIGGAPQWFRIDGSSQEIFEIVNVFFANRETSSWIEQVIKDAEKFEGQAREGRALAEWMSTHMMSASSSCVAAGSVPCGNGSAIAL